MNFEEGNGLELASTYYSFLVTGDAQHHNGERVERPVMGIIFVL